LSFIVLLLIADLARCKALCAVLSPASYESGIAERKAAELQFKRHCVPFKVQSSGAAVQKALRAGDMELFVGFLASGVGGEV